jgi:gamma-glutamylcyclotransferase (GGCT)/AIG2-like uncharacterized protein YtfP
MYYFAYSLNLNKKKMAETCPQSRPLYIATLHNYRLLFTGWTRQWHGGVATIQRSTGDKVLGAIYDVPDAEWGRLDKSEDCSGNFERIRVIVNNEDGDATEATTYIRKGQIKIDESRPSPEYLQIIQQGYKDWHLI